MYYVHVRVVLHVHVHIFSRFNLELIKWNLF